ncbi:hypothetical protein [Pseudoduganella sp.]|uniref:hypothetical protein n=1 Tax=Pseudoduganella sp. TaxID=1880898 RepID=UPI0035ADE064
MRQYSVCRAVIAAVISAFAMPVVAQECVSDFKAEEKDAGVVSYSAVAPLPGKSADQAFQLSQQVASQAGWMVYQTIPEVHTAFARDSKGKAGDKRGELVFATAMGEHNLLMALVYNDPPGANTPKSVVSDQFCKIAKALRKRIAAAPPDLAAPVKAPQAAGVEVAGRNAALAGARPADKLCLRGACLGMSVGEARRLKLEPARAAFMQFGPEAPGAGRAVSTDGRLIYVTDGAWLDSKSVAAFARGVRTICELRSGSFAHMKAEDGKQIKLHFSPTVRDGKGTLILRKIERLLPAMSQMDYGYFQRSVAEEYGAAYVNAGQVPPADRPYVQMKGWTLTLALPEEDLGARLMETPGCSEKAALK